MHGGFKTDSTRNLQELFHHCGCKEDGEKLSVIVDVVAKFGQIYYCVFQVVDFAPCPQSALFK